MCTLQHHVNVDDYEHTAARKRRRVRCIEKAAAARAQEERAVLDEAAKKARLLAWGQLPRKVVAANVSWRKPPVKPAASPPMEQARSDS